MKRIFAILCAAIILFSGWVAFAIKEIPHPANQSCFSKTMLIDPYLTNPQIKLICALKSNT